jgi:AraC-like DNA-binding protein/mannose-6-phosphate isomerase-like protein (cupin superfamily)
MPIPYVTRDIIEKSSIKGEAPGSCYRLFFQTDGERNMETLKHVQCEKRTYSYKVDTHEHSYGQFLFPLQGSMEIDAGQQLLKLDSQHCLYLPPQCRHQFHSLDRNEFLVLDIPFHYVSEAGDGAGMYMKLDEQWSALRFLLLEEVSKNGGSTGVGPLVQYMSQKLTQWEHPSMAYMHTHYRESMTIDELAKMEHYHPAYYSSWFKAKTGRTPLEYLHQLRLKEAKRLLREVSWTITAIAHEVGYEHASSLTRLFLRYEGITPNAYRNTLK